MSTTTVLCTFLLLAAPTSPKSLSSLQSTELPAWSNFNTDPIANTSEEPSGSDITTDHNMTVDQETLEMSPHVIENYQLGDVGGYNEATTYASTGNDVPSGSDNAESSTREAHLPATSVYPNSNPESSIHPTTLLPATEAESRTEIQSLYTSMPISDSAKSTLQMSLTDARFKATDALDNYGNQPFVTKLRGDIETRDFAAEIAIYFPLLPQLGNVQNNFNQEEGLRVLDREITLLKALSRKLLDLEEAYVTRYGDECGMPTQKPEINYFCRETRISMRNLINALNETHIKLNRRISSPSAEDETPQFPLPGVNDGAQAIRYNILAGLHQIQRRAVALEIILSTI